MTTETLTPEARDFAILLAQARYACLLRARQAGQDGVPPSPYLGLPGAPAVGVPLQTEPAGVPITPAGDVGLLADVTTPNLQRRSQNGAAVNARLI